MSVILDVSIDIMAFLTEQLKYFLALHFERILPSHFGGGLLSCIQAMQINQFSLTVFWILFKGRLPITFKIS